MEEKRGRSGRRRRRGVWRRRRVWRRWRRRRKWTKVVEEQRRWMRGGGEGVGRRSWYKRRGGEQGGGARQINKEHNYF